MKPTTKLAGAILAIEEDPTDLTRYKRIHDINCKGCKDPEQINVDASIRTARDLAGLLVGHAITESHDDLQSLNDALMHCARRALAL